MVNFMETQDLKIPQDSLNPLSNFHSLHTLSSNLPRSLGCLNIQPGSNQSTTARHYSQPYKFSNIMLCYAVGQLKYNTQGSRLLRWVVLLVPQVALQGVVLDHLHVLQDQRSAVSLGIDSMVLLALSKGLVSDSELLVSDPLFSHHRSSGLLDLGVVLVVNVIERHQLWSRVVFVRGCLLVLIFYLMCWRYLPMVEVVGRFTKRLILTGGCNLGRALPDGYGGVAKKEIRGSLGGVSGIEDG